MDRRRLVKLAALCLAAFLGAAQAEYPVDLPWWVQAVTVGLIAAATTLNGYLDTGVARGIADEEKRNGKPAGVL